VGLKYGRIIDMDFHDFHVLPGTIFKAPKANGITVSDSVSLILEGKSIPEGNFIHLYDSTPYQILEGHIAAKLPCNEENVPEIQLLVGQAPNLYPTELDLVNPLSTSGELCLYHTDLKSNGPNPITDIAIQNNSTDDIDFPSTSTITIDVSKIKQL
jgi:hypothetical protein